MTTNKALVEALRRIRQLSPDELWGVPDRDTGDRPSFEALDADEVFGIIDTALASSGNATGDDKGLERAWRDGFNDARRCVSDDVAFELTEDVEQDTWLDSETRLTALSSGNEVAKVVGRQPIDTAPKDGTIVELVVDYSDGHHPLHDATLAPTIGQNSFDNTGIDEWQFAGWNWCQDVFNQGQGTVRAWRPSGLNAYDDGLSPLPLASDAAPLTGGPAQ